MPDDSFPVVDPCNAHHSVIGTLGGVEQPAFLGPWVESVQEPWNESWLLALPARSAEISSLLRPLNFHAEPLSPLRQRDEQALDEFFEDAQIEEIFVDIGVRLRQLYPEPCWEDDPYDFLKGYM